MKKITEKNTRAKTQPNLLESLLHSTGQYMSTERPRQYETTENEVPYCHSTMSPIRII